MTFTAGEPPFLLRPIEWLNGRRGILARWANVRHPKFIKLLDLAVKKQGTLPEVGSVTLLCQLSWDIGMGRLKKVMAGYDGPDRVILMLLGERGGRNHVFCEAISWEDFSRAREQFMKENHDGEQKLDWRQWGF